MSALDLSKTFDDPTQLFLQLWLTVSQRTASQRTNSISPTISVKNTVETAFNENAGVAVCDILKKIISSSLTDDQNFVGTVLFVMKQINAHYGAIHPRTRGAFTGTSRKLKSWLADCEQNRYLTGSYFSQDGLRVVPQGPLASQPRNEHESGGESLQDLFSILTVADEAIVDRGRTSRIEIKFVRKDNVAGVIPLSNIGTERIGFFPLAEGKEELLATKQIRADDKVFVSYGPSEHFKPSTKIHALAKAIGDVDIILAPELVMPEQEADELVRAIDDQGPIGAKLMILGSGATKANEYGQPYNESRIVNSHGNELWRQRKIWPSFLDRRRACACNLPDPGENGVVFEDNASGNELVVCDLEGFGRCIVLICQDLQDETLAKAVGQYQPDWIFAPVLDFEAGLDAGRWVHQRAFEISGTTNTRFLVANSTSLAELVGKLDTCFCGLAVGPKSQGRKFMNVKSNGAVPGYAVVKWGSGTWQTTMLQAETPPAT